jgi:hypothetical protein
MRRASVTVSRNNPPQPRTAVEPTFRVPLSVADLDAEIASLRDAIEEELGVVRTLTSARAGGRARSGERMVLSAFSRHALAFVRAARRLRQSIPRLARSRAGSARIEDHPRPRLARARTVNVGDVAFALLSLMAAGLFALYVVVLFAA